MTCVVSFVCTRQEDKEILEQQMHDMALMVERLESSRQKLLTEVSFLLIKIITFASLN